MRDLQRLFLLEASKYNVFPLDDRRYERFNSDLAGRPQLVKGNTQMLFGGMGRLSENSVINIKNKSHAITADLTVPAAGAAGVIIAQGGRFGGWALYVRDGKPAYCYNLLGVQQFKIYGDTELTSGDHQVRMEFAYDGGGLGKGGTVNLYIDGEPVGEGRVEATQPMIFSADETTDIGGDSATPVSDDYSTDNSTFTGRVRRVQIDLGDGCRGRRPPHLPRRALPDRGRAAVDDQGPAGTNNAPSPGRSWSLRGVAAVDRECHSDDEAGAGAAQPEDGGGDLLASADAADRVEAATDARSSSPLATMSATMAVSMVPGQIALTRIPRGAYSKAALVVSPITPCLDAW